MCTVWWTVGRTNAAKQRNGERRGEVLQSEVVPKPPNSIHSWAALSGKKDNFEQASMSRLALALLFFGVMLHEDVIVPVPYPNVNGREKRENVNGRDLQEREESLLRGAIRMLTFLDGEEEVL